MCSVHPMSSIVSALLMAELARDSHAHGVYREIDMHTGVMWFDSAAGMPLGSRLEKATRYYTRKYGRAPNLCLVHPSLLDSSRGQFGKVTVRAYPFVLPGHFWIGVEDTPRNRRSKA